MFIRYHSILLIFCVFVILIDNETNAKPFLEFFYDSPKFQQINYHKHHQHYSHHNHVDASPPERPEPVGGKERFKQICNIIRGINDCYA